MANALEAASLVMIPSGYEDGTLGSLKPTDGTGDFTFSRGSDISATRVNEQGYIEKGYENTLLGSNDWAQSDSQYEITGGEVGYDGTNDAWLVNKLAAAYFSKDALVLAGVMTISFFAKAGSLDRIFVFIGGEAARFDLTNGTATKAGGNPVSQNIELVSGTTDWYRCSIVINKTSTQNFLIKPQNSSNQDVTGTIYIQDAMLNQGLVAYPYVETTTAPVAGGILEDMPRLDYSDSSCPALLLEPQRTNLVSHSEYFGGWQTASSPTITANAAVSPEGVQNAYLLTSTAASSRVQVPVSPTGTNIQSVYIKYAGSDARVRISGLASANSRFEVNVTSSGVAFHSAQSGIIDYAIESVGNDWYRVTSTQSGGNYYQIYIDVTGNNGSIYIYGAQLEQDATYPTSYIPTYGTSQTRLEDLTTGAGNASIFNDSEGVLYAEISAPDDLNIDGISVSDGSTSNRVVIFTWNSSNTMRARVSSNGVNVLNQTIIVSDITDFNKIAISYKLNDFKVYLNGTNVFSETSGATPIGLNTLSFTTDGGISTPFYGNAKQVLYFPTALSDDECIELTTI